MIAASFALALLLQSPAPTSSPPAAPSTTQQPASTPAPALDEAQKLRVENHALKTRLAQLEVQLAQLQLTQERNGIEASLLAAYPGWRMDWQTLQLVAVPAASTSPPTKED